MKIYKKPELIIRLSISKIGEDTYYLNFVDTSIDECINKVKGAISSLDISPFERGNSIRIDFRESVNGLNGKSKSISFKGMSTFSVAEFLYEYDFNLM